MSPADASMLPALSPLASPVKVKSASSIDKSAWPHSWGSMPTVTVEVATGPVAVPSLGATVQAHSSPSLRCLASTVSAFRCVLASASNGDPFRVHDTVYATASPSVSMLGLSISQRRSEPNGRGWVG